MLPGKLLNVKRDNCRGSIHRTRKAADGGLSQIYGPLGRRIGTVPSDITAKRERKL